jgi:hypothetical protein
MVAAVRRVPALPSFSRPFRPARPETFGRAGTRAGLVSACVLVTCVACGAGEDAPMLQLAPRPASAPGGAELARALRSLEFEAREERIYDEVARGNVPSWLRRLERVEIGGEIDGRRRWVAFWAMPDYLSVGSDDDYFLVPLSAGTAQRIADLVGGSLPAPAMVDAVWSSASVRLIPIRIRPDENIRTVRYFERHNSLIQGQRWQHRVPRGAFIAGHKLDVVATAGGAARDDAALYGWHLPGGRPIQPVYAIAPDRPPQFSIGVRLVHREILVDGRRGELADALRDPELLRLLGGQVR